jgi:hypothetical protein
MKNLINKFKKKDKFPTPQEPRSQEALKAEMQSLLVNLGNERYLMAVHESAVNQLLQRVANLNTEGAERARIDSEAAKAVEGSKIQQAPK